MINKGNFICAHLVFSPGINDCVLLNNFTRSTTHKMSDLLTKGNQEFLELKKKLAQRKPGCNYGFRN